MGNLARVDVIPFFEGRNFFPIVSMTAEDVPHGKSRKPTLRKGTRDFHAFCCNCRYAESITLGFENLAYPGEQPNPTPKKMMDMFVEAAQKLQKIHDEICGQNTEKACRELIRIS